MAHHRSNSKRFRSRSMEKLRYPDPPKKRLKHSIESILRSPSPTFITDQQGGGQKIEQFVQQLADEIEHNTKFNLVKTHTKFMIRDLPADPESLLHSIFQQCIDRAMAQAREKGCVADRLGCVITSELLENDIWIPVRPLSDDTTNSILNRFLLIAQSKKQNDITILGQPFSVAITTINRDGLNPKIKGGTGRKLKFAPLRHSIKEQCLIKV